MSNTGLIGETTTAVLQCAIEQIREEIARSRAFNTGLCLGMKLNEESDLYQRFRYLDVVPTRLQKTVTLLQNLLVELETKGPSV